jgi:transcriptional regulator with XRE-family HTH domain
MPKKNIKIDDIHVHIGNKIKIYRYEIGLSRSELAPKINISQQQLTKYEAGVNKISVGRLLLLANVLNKNITDFIYTDEWEINTENLSRIDMEILCNLSSIKNPELKENINTLIKTTIKSYVDTTEIKKFG